MPLSRPKYVRLRARSLHAASLYQCTRVQNPTRIFASIVSHGLSHLSHIACLHCIITVSTSSVPAATSA